MVYSLMSDTFPNGAGLIRCRGCLGPLAESRAGLCGRCWSGLVPLPEERCPRCALPHGGGPACPEPVAWSRGDALWNYRAGRPALGALLVPGIKRGELGWKAALLERAGRAPLPGFTGAAIWSAAPPPPCRGAGAAASTWRKRPRRLFARRLGLPFRALLRKAWFSPGPGGPQRRTPAPSARFSREPAPGAPAARGNDPAGGRCLDHRHHAFALCPGPGPGGSGGSGRAGPVPRTARMKSSSRLGGFLDRLPPHGPFEVSVAASHR